MWITVIDYGGVGDVLASAIALSAFRGAGVNVNFVSRTWDCYDLLMLLRPSWWHLCEANPRHLPTDDATGLILAEMSSATVRFTPYLADGFYQGRINALACAINAFPGRMDTHPFRRIAPRSDLPSRRYVVIHAKAAWMDKSITSEELESICEIVRNHRLVPVVVGNEFEPWGKLVSMVENAEACICTDSCVSHIAHWLHVPSMVIYKTTEPGYIWRGVDNPPITSRSVILRDIDRFLSESVFS